MKELNDYPNYIYIYCLHLVQRSLERSDRLSRDHEVITLVQLFPKNSPF
jgi:hypothetical protein